MTIGEIEDVLIEAVTGLALFAVVDSIGRDKEPPADAIFDYPYASVFFLEDEEVSNAGRPIDKLTFGVLVSVKNLAGEKEAAADAYALVDGVRGALRGKSLGVAGIEPLSCPSRQLVGYQDGVMTYLLLFTTRQYQPVVTD